MSKLSQTMKMVSGSTTYNVPFYTTTGEASAYGTYGTANVGGTTCYYGLGTGADAAHGSGVKTPLKVISGSTTYYMLTKGNGELATYNLVLAGTSNQTITLKYKNRNYSDTGYEAEVTKTSTGSNQTFTVRKGTTWTATVAGATGWNAGALSASSGTVSAATTVSAGAATYKTFTLTKSATNASTNQTLTVQYQNKASNGTFGTKTTLSSGSVTLGYGSHWWGTVAASTGYNAGAVTNAGGNSSSMTGNVTVSVAAASLKTYTLTKSATNASTNQTLTVKYAKATSSSAWGSQTTLSSGSVTLTHFSKWWGTVAASTGYNAGAVTNPGGDSARMTGNVTVSVAAASLKTYTLTLAATSNQTITLKYKNRNSANNGYETEVTKTSTSSAQNFTVRHGTTWTATIAGASGYNPGALSASSGTVSGNTTVSAGAASAALPSAKTKLGVGAYTHVEFGGDSNEYTVTIPTGVKVLLIETEDGGDGNFEASFWYKKNNGNWIQFPTSIYYGSTYVGVTAGAKYTFSADADASDGYGDCSLETYYSASINNQTPAFSI